MTSRWTLAAGLAVVLGLAALMARAEEVNRCIDRCFGGVGDQPGYTTLRDMCVQQCGKNATPYGAIAYGAESQAAGWSYDYRTKGDADQQALANCAKYGDDCKVVVTIFNSCAAVAAGDNKRFAVAQARRGEQAQANAVAACTQQGGTNCEVKAWSCAFQ
jgi:hypothetical protein